MRRWMTMVSVTVLFACGDSSPTDTGNDNPPDDPAAWSVAVDSTLIGDDYLVTAEAKLAHSASVSMSFECARPRGGGDLLRLVKITALGHTFASQPFVLTTFYPDAGSGNPPWFTATGGSSVGLWNEDADDVAHRSLAADSVRASWTVGDVFTDHTWDTRALEVAIDSLGAWCNWSPS